MPCNLEEAIVQAAVPHFLYQFLLGGGIVLIEAFVCLARAFEANVGYILEKSRIGGASPALGILMVFVGGQSCCDLGGECKCYKYDRCLMLSSDW